MYTNITDLLPSASAKAALDFVVQETRSTLGRNLVGIYVFGSLTYGAFEEGRSDIDLVAVLRQTASNEELERLKAMFSKLEGKNPEWHERIECSFTPVHMLLSVTRPDEPRPWFGNSRFHERATYGNEWLINQYLLCRDGIALCGPPYSTLVSKAIDIKAVQEAAAEDLQTEWAPLVHDKSPLDDPHVQSYVVLNLCRILYTIQMGQVGSKQEASSWVSNRHPAWKDLIEEAGNWRYGIKIDRAHEVQRFVVFVLGEVIN